MEKMYNFHNAKSGKGSRGLGWWGCFGDKLWIPCGDDFLAGSGDKDPITQVIAESLEEGS